MYKISFFWVSSIRYKVSDLILRKKIWSDLILSIRYQISDIYQFKTVSNRSLTNIWLVIVRKDWKYLTTKGNVCWITLSIHKWSDNLSWLWTLLINIRRKSQLIQLIQSCTIFANFLHNIIQLSGQYHLIFGNSKW